MHISSPASRSNRFQSTDYTFLSGFVYENFCLHLDNAWRSFILYLKAVQADKRKEKSPSFCPGAIRGLFLPFIAETRDISRNIPFFNFHLAFPNKNL